MYAPSLLFPDWPLPPGVQAVSTLRRGAGASRGAWGSFNLGQHVGDAAATVAANRRQLASLIGLDDRVPVWLRQEHGVAVARLDQIAPGAPAPVADGAVLRGADRACALLTADCLPVLLCELSGAVLGAAHAGWRGLARGVLEATVEAMKVAPHRLTAWLGPCISAPAFEVGPEVRDAFVARDPQAAHAFQAGPGDRCFADLQLLARQRLLAMGVQAEHVYAFDACTYHERERFFSYRRDGVCGRMASLIWRTDVPIV